MTATLLPRTINIDTGDHFWIENTHATETIHLQWARKPYDVLPGDQVLVPFEVVSLFYGDPRSRVGVIQQYADSTGSGQVPERMAEVQRLCVRYGVYEQGMEDIHESLSAESIRLQHEGRRPLSDVNFYARILTADKQSEIIPPLLDAKGEMHYGFTKSVQRSDDIATLMISMQDQLDSLRAQQEALLERGADNDDSDVETDD